MPPNGGHGRLFLSAAIVGTILASAGVLARSDRPETVRPVRLAGIPAVSIDAVEAYVPQYDGSFWVVQTTEVPIPVVLSEPAPPGGFNVTTSGNMVPPVGSVFFGGGAIRTTATRTFPTSPLPAPFYPGWFFQWGYFVLATPPDSVTIGTPSVIYLTRTLEAGLSSPGESCVYNFWFELLCAMGITSACSGRVVHPEMPALPVGVDGRQVLGRYRDEVLATTVEGQYYIDLYNQLSPDLMRATVRSPSLPVRVLLAQDPWLGGFQALVDGQGDQFIVTTAMQNSLLALLNTYELVGSPTVRSSLAFERDRLNLDAIAGLTMTQFQQQIETLGGPSSVEATSWGEMKGRYRDAGR
jgi:hypothetical protein